MVKVECTYFSILISGAIFASCGKMSRVFQLQQQNLIAASEMKVTSIKPVVAKPGETVTVTGSNLNQQAVLRIGEQVVSWASTSSTSATFVMPSTARPGVFEIKIGRSSDPSGVVAAAAKFIISDSAGDGVPINMATVSDICTGKKFRDGDGVLQTGTKVCVGVGPDLTLLVAENIKSGVTINKVVGSYVGSYANCTLNGELGCLTTATFKAADLTNLTAGNIKSGVSIAGQLGDYPSSTYPLPDSSTTADLTAATFNAQVKSSATFEYWDSSGTRQTGTGDTNIVGSNIASTATIFGTSGTLTSPVAWDLRRGTSVVTSSGNVVGKLKVNCRNTANLAVYDAQLPGVNVSTPGASGPIANLFKPLIPRLPGFSHSWN